MLNDSAQRLRAIDPTQSFIVQAPAGSGKTSLLTLRILNLLATAVTQPEQILAITFTRKAAEEMRTRILGCLANASANEVAPDTAYKRQQFELAQQVLQKDASLGWDLLQNPQRLKIQTIDAFFGFLTQQMPICAKLGANPNIAEDPKQLYILAVRQFFTGMSQQHPGFTAMQTLYLHLGGNQEKLSQLIVQMLPQREQWLGHMLAMRQQDLAETLQAGLACAYLETLESLHALAPPCGTPVASCLKFAQSHVPDPALRRQWQVCQGLTDWPEPVLASIEQWRVIADFLLNKKDAWRQQVTHKLGFPAATATQDKLKKSEYKQRKSDFSGLLAFLTEAVEFRERLSMLRRMPRLDDQIMWETCEALAEILPEVVGHLKLVFAKYNQVDFPEMTLAAGEALGHSEAPTDLALVLDYQIQHLLIDEFQDTSQAQFQIFQQLVAGWMQGDNKTVFLVGDPMQSIYRFRKAQVGLFLQARDHGIGQLPLTYLQLTTNFRASPNLIDWINQTMLRTFPNNNDAAIGAIAYACSKAEQATNKHSNVHFYQLSQTSGPKVEAQAIVECIQRCRAVDPADSIAVLVRSRRHVKDLLPALGAAGIVYHATEMEKLNQRQIILDLLSLTEGLLHLDNRIAWLGICRAPWLGMTLAELSLVAQEQAPIWARLQQPEVQAVLSPSMRERCQIVCHHVAAALTALQGQSLTDVITKLWHNLGGGAQLRYGFEWEEVNCYFDLLRAWQDKPELYQPGFFSEQISLQYKRGGNPGGNPVQIMTIHKAKGLEFDQVILCGLERRLVADPEQLMLWAERYYQTEPYLLLAPLKSVQQTQDPHYQFLKYLDGQQNKYEMMRLLYVALTRARRQLHLFASVGDNKPIANSFLAMLTPMPAHTKIMLPKATAISSERQVACAGKRVKQLAIEVLTPMSAPLVPKLTEGEIQPEVCLENPYTLVGTTVHRLFEALSKGIISEQAAMMPDCIRCCLQQQTRQARSQPELEALILQAVTRTLNCRQGRWIVLGPHVESYAEWPLMLNQAQQVSRLVLDRAFMDARGTFWIIDYKVCHQDELEQKIAEYTPQLEKYRRAVRRLNRYQTIQCGLYFPLQARIETVSMVPV